MTDTTPVLGLPYPESSDARGAGAPTIQELAEAVEAELLARDAIVAGATAIASATAGRTGSTALADNVATALAYDWADADGPFTYNGSTTFTYDGPTRWFMVSGGLNLAVNGTLPQGHLRLMVNNAEALRFAMTDNYDNLGFSVPLLLAAANTVHLDALAANPETAGGAYDNAYLRLIAVTGPA